MEQQRQRSVADLRPRKGVNVESNMLVGVAARKMLARNTDAVLVVSAQGDLEGILTDSDVTRKVLALGLDPDVVSVNEVMTKQPQCVRDTDSAIDALCTMVENRFRHLPVLSEGGEVIGVLDIAKCLYDAISRLERHVTTATSNLSSAMLRALPSPGVDGSATTLVNSMVQKLFSPSLADLIEKHEKARATSGTNAPASIDASASTRTAAEAMAARRGGLIVQSDGQPCAGIVTPKDLLFRVVAKGLPPSTEVEAVMTPQPDTMPGTATVLQGLHQLQYGGYRNLPVVSPSGEPLGVLDVLTLMEGALRRERSGDTEGAGLSSAALKQHWRGFWDTAESLVGAGTASNTASNDGPSHRSTTSDGADGLNGGEGGSHGGSAPSATSGPFLFKVADVTGQMHRMRASTQSYAALHALVAEKLGREAEAADMSLRYDDDEGDRVVLSTDAELHEAVEMARKVAAADDACCPCASTIAASCGSD